MEMFVAEKFSHCHAKLPKLTAKIFLQQIVLGKRLFLSYKTYDRENFPPKSFTAREFPDLRFQLTGKFSNAEMFSLKNAAVLANAHITTNS